MSILARILKETDAEHHVPDFLKTHMDFINNLLIVVIGFVLRSRGIIQEKHLPGMQLMTFTFCLPSVVFNVAWSSVIETTMMKVLFVSAVTNCLWVLFVVFFLRITNPRQKGMFFMTSCAAAMPFVYPVVLQSPRFEEKGAAIVLMWEFGGNLMVAFVLFGIIGQKYAPVSIRKVSEDILNDLDLVLDPAHVTLEDAVPEVSMAGQKPGKRSRHGTEEEVQSFTEVSSPMSGGGTPAARRTTADATTMGDGETEMADQNRRISAPAIMSAAEAARVSTLAQSNEGDGFDGVAPSVLGNGDGEAAAAPPVAPMASDDVESQDPSVRSRVLLSVTQFAQLVAPGLKTPVVMAAVVGLCLNALSVPMYPLPARAAEAFMSAFPPLLYSFVGANLRFNLGKESYFFIAKALCCRLCICAIVAFTGRFLWPVDDNTKGVLTLCVSAPTAISFILWTARYEYPLDQASMLFNMSAVSSLMIMSLISPIV